MTRINHKMVAWVLLVVAGLYGATWAAEPEAPVLKNPQALYSTYFEKTDGSENLLYLLLDQTNDESRNIERYGALIIHQTDFDAQGKMKGEAHLTLQNCDYGKLLITALSDNAFAGANYVVGDRMYQTALGILVGRGENPEPEYLNYCWQSIHFPYGNLEVLNGVRQDGCGYSYFLARSDEKTSFEFVADSSMQIEELRIYVRDAAGDMALNSVLRYSLGEAKPIPAMVRSAMEEDFAGNNS